MGGCLAGCVLLCAVVLSVSVTPTLRVCVSAVRVSAAAIAWGSTDWIVM